MKLPFTREQFFDLFVSYNESLRPVAVALWIVSAVIVAVRLSVRRPHDRWISALLVTHWAWSALAYHVAFFTRINPAAWLFAALFLGQFTPEDLTQERLLNLRRTVGRRAE